MSQVTAEQASEQIRQVYKIWTEAVGGAVKDPAFFDRHVDDSWWYVDFHGVKRTKDQYRQLVDTIVWYKQDMKQLSARMVAEDLAAVTGVYDSSAEVVSGERLSNTIIFSALWQLRDGVWKTLMHHTTRVPAHVF